MMEMFQGCTSFNQPLDNWDISFPYTDNMFDECTSFTQPVETWKKWKDRLNKKTFDMIRSNIERIKKIRDSNINNLQSFTRGMQQAEQRKLQGITIKGTPVQFTDPTTRVLTSEDIMRGEIAKWFGGRKKTKRSKKRSTLTHKKTKRRKNRSTRTHKKIRVIK
jgi:hypothetical protein